MKKIINSPQKVVYEMCNGIAMAHPEVEFVRKYKVIKKKNINKNKVTLISGGGSGHEPAHAGFIGQGMLDAAVCGDVFASPSQIQVYQAIKATASEKGTLLIIKNYSGDMMNFKNGAFLAEQEGIKVDFVKVDDDIAVQDSLYTVGRRGVAGTVLVHKCAGAAAERGKSLEEVKAVAEKVIKNVRTIGFALTSCTVPAKGTPTFELGEEEMEYGVGIHGEPGIKREAIQTADELAAKMVSALLKDLGMKSKSSMKDVCVLINGFGGTPLQELYLLNNSVARELSARGVTVYRTFVGNYMTSIDMAGASISILKLDRELKSYLNAKSDAPAFKVNGQAPEQIDYVDAFEGVNDDKPFDPIASRECDCLYTVKDNKLTTKNMIYIVDKMAEIIIDQEQPYCELDSHAGDGDFGMSVAKGFRQLKREWSDILPNATNIGAFLYECSLVIMQYCGGASGPIWGSAFLYASRKVGAKTEIGLKEFAELMQAAVKGVQETGARSFGRGAVVGDKTLIDALVPCADALSECAMRGASLSVAFKKGAEAAVEGAAKTAEHVAHMGRAGTVGERSIGYPDAGAFALGDIFTKISADLFN